MQLKTETEATLFYSMPAK